MRRCWCWSWFERHVIGISQKKIRSVRRPVSARMPCCIRVFRFRRQWHLVGIRRRRLLLLIAAVIVSVAVHQRLVLFSFFLISRSHGLIESIAAVMLCCCQTNRILMVDVGVMFRDPPTATCRRHWQNSNRGRGGATRMTLQKCQSRTQ